ncbi:hypothetical protein NN3_18780 [Nocardia neocaledoniensis NBRC 108232]|uniref:Uncharacterized protein n=1 Tax=Nocardia neocaledoniensis TaxID=236511 RepID=A0A317NAH8_9NOCA|nr:hypothetical protein [Nocardia neocaledoniensis]PWV71707.1 hypothetical protein DFR69_110191 [Nocardia neocaledoniensis]GEM30871.1 hypothetical protein NN3_18780 [Nocardia neocaledoniensis NBRC 108232]
MRQEESGRGADSSRRSGADRWRLGVAVVAGVVAAAAGLFWLSCAYLVARSRWSSDPLADPHGYGLIFGSVCALPAAAIIAVTVPLVLPPGRNRVRLVGILIPLVLLVSGLLLVALVTA